MDTTTILPLSALASAVLALWVLRGDLATAHPVDAAAAMVHMQADPDDLVVLYGRALRLETGRFEPLATVATEMLPEDTSAFGRVFVVHRGTADPLVAELEQRGFLLWQDEAPPWSVSLFQLDDAELPVSALELMLPSGVVTRVDREGRETACVWNGSGHRCESSTGITSARASVAVHGEPRRCARLQAGDVDSTRIEFQTPRGATHIAGWFALDGTASSPGAAATLEIDAGVASRTVLVSPGRVLATVDWALPVDASDTTTLHMRADTGDVTVCGELRWVERATHEAR